MELLNSAMTGLMTGIFSAGAVWGVLKTEMRYLRRDLDELRDKCQPCGSRHA